MAALTSETHSDQTRASVAIMMCTYNGERYLDEQLASFVQQSHRTWSLHISDDGSSDRTHQLIENFAQTYPGHTVTWREGPRQGFSKNFVSLMCDESIAADYFALADQDDVWFPDKLERALAALQTVPSNVPALYGSRTALVDESLQRMGMSPLFRNQPDLRNALVQTFAGGNTMVMNAAARRLLLKAGAEVDVYAHDWWLSLVVAAVGGPLLYDPQPSLYYRQHRGNQLGHNTSIRGKWQRFEKLFSGNFAEWSNRNLTALEALRSEIPKSNQQLLDDYAAWRQQGLSQRLKGMWRSALFRQDLPGQLALWLAVCLKKV